MDELKLWLPAALQFQNAGFFVSRGRGRHADRIISSHELILVERGELAMYEEDREFHLCAGQTLLLFPGRRHGGLAPYPANLRFYWMHFNPVSADAFQPPDASKIVERKMRNHCGVRIFQHAAPGDPGRLLWVLRRLLDDQETGRIAPLSSSALLTLLLVELGIPAPAGRVQDVTQERGHGVGTEERLAQHIDEIIGTRFHQPLNVSAIARELRYNPDYLTRLYRRARGRPISEAVHLRRLRQARQLLLEGTMNISEICLECGFGDPAHFRKVFRRHEGVTPGEYRGLCARMHINTE